MDNVGKREAPSTPAKQSKKNRRNRTDVATSGLKDREAPTVAEEDTRESARLMLNPLREAPTAPSIIQQFVSPPQHTYKYVHLDSNEKNAHETSSKLDVYLNNHPIKHCRRVGILKATITNTGHNVFFNHDSLLLGIYPGSTGVVVAFRFAHRYYTLAEFITAFNDKLQNYTNADANLQLAVRAISATVSNDRLVLTYASIAGGSTAAYTLLGDSNSLWYDLGFDRQQIGTQTEWVALQADFAANGASSVYVKQSVYSTAPVTVTNTFPHTGWHFIKLENSRGFYFASSSLTRSGNVLRTRVYDGRASVELDDHLLYVPNQSDREEYCHHTNDMIEWHDIQGDIQHFDIELRNHADKLFKSDLENIESESGAGASPPFTLTLIFECAQPDSSHGHEIAAYQAEGYARAHKIF